MTRLAEFDTEQLLDQASTGDPGAREQLMVRHRARLRQMVASRLDRSLAARVDPSDVVQEALADAAGKLSDYLRTRPLPFYPWLRKLAWQRLVDLHRRHVRAKSRSVTREAGQVLPLADESAVQLAERVLATGAGPMSNLLQAELRSRVRVALGALPEPDREVLVLRHLEQLSTKEMAAVLGISEGAVKMRQIRALARFRDELDGRNREEES
jgi:RNA polymerase sigma-70 factor (ECF subfamily)